MILAVARLTLVVENARVAQAKIGAPTLGPVVQYPVSRATVQRVPAFVAIFLVVPKRSTLGPCLRRAIRRVVRIARRVVRRIGELLPGRGAGRFVREIRLWDPGSRDRLG